MRQGPFSLLVLGAVAAAVSVPALGDAIASATSSGPSALHRTPASALVTRHLAAASTCVRQDDNDNGVGIVSMNFEADFDAYDSRAADDFTLKRACTVNQVDVDGAYFFGVGPVISMHITFYADNAGTPGARVANQNGLTFTDPSGLGNLDIPLTAPVTLQPGAYWVSVKANIDFRGGGEWGWNTNNTARGHNAQWKNGRDGFDTGCRTYAEVLGCLGDGGQGPDFSFALLK